MKTPYSIVFSDNGSAYVLDREGRRIHEYEGATHADCIALLRLNGFNWAKLERRGEPKSFPVRR